MEAETQAGFEIQKGVLMSVFIVIGNLFIWSQYFCMVGKKIVWMKKKNAAYGYKM